MHPFAFYMDSQMFLVPDIFVLIYVSIYKFDYICIHIFNAIQSDVIVLSDSIIIQCLEPKVANCIISGWTVEINSLWALVVEGGNIIKPFERQFSRVLFFLLHLRTNK